MPRYDIHFQPVMPTSDIHGYKAFTFGFTTSLQIRGPQALVNRWTKTFMTPKGSDLLHPSYGTAFGGMMGSNIVTDFSVLQDTIIMAIDDASDQVRQQDADNLMSSEESLASATMTKFVPSAGGDGFDVWILINNKAGRALPVKMTLMATR